MSVNVAFVTIGQSPRPDILPEILEHTRTKLSATERGALDGLSDDEIAALAPGPDELRLVTRLRDGREVLLGKPAIDRRLHAILAELDEGGFDLLVLLCTGQFNQFRTRTALIEPQHTVDHFAQGLAYGATRIGIVVPDKSQVDEFHGIPDIATTVACASPYLPGCDDALRKAGKALAGTDIIVMHCMGYTEAMRHTLKESTGRPVLVSRRLVASAIDLILS
jgi:protein AroM